MNNSEINNQSNSQTSTISSTSPVESITAQQPIPDNNKNKVKKPKKDSVILKFIDSFMDIFRLSIKGITYPLKTMFNASAKVLDDTVKTVTPSSTKEKIKKESKIAKFFKDLENKLGISQKALEKLENQRHKLQVELENEDVKRTDKAKIYVYKVKDHNGKISTGRFTGFSKMDVNSFLLNEGYEVYSIENNKTIDFIYGESNFVPRTWNNKDLIFWLTQLATYIKSGIPLTESIKILMNQMGKDKNKKIVMQSIAYELTMGNTFSKALEKQGTIFPPLLINMLKAAEATGELEETLTDMANYYTEIEATRKQMISAMTYPAIVSVFALGVIIFIILYVVPQFTQIYAASDITVTGLTKFIVDLSDFLKQYYAVIILVIFGIVLGIYFIYKKIKIARREIQIFLMKLPVIGNIIIYNEITIFTKTFASLLKNNVFITESIDILSKITNNEIYKEIMFETINNIASGNKISQAFKDHWAVPDVAYYMIVTGESTGELANMMQRVSEYYQDQHRSIINNLKSLIEPVMISTLAVVVGGIILSVIIPMFQMYESVSGS